MVSMTWGQGGAHRKTWRLPQAISLRTEPGNLQSSSAAQFSRAASSRFIRGGRHSDKIEVLLNNLWDAGDNNGVVYMRLVAGNVQKDDAAVAQIDPRRPCGQVANYERDDEYDGILEGL